MIFKRKFEKAFINRHVKIGLNQIAEQLKQIRAYSSLIAISPTPTQYNWLGVNRATHNLFPFSTFNIPQYYSQTVYSDQELRKMVQIIIDLGFEKIIFSGFSGYFVELIKMIKQQKKNIFIGLIYHGSLSELAGNEIMQNDFIKIIEMVREGNISRIAYIKKGLDLCIKKIYGLTPYSLIIPPPDVSGIKKEKINGKKNIHIGVFANKQLRKNVHNQIAAGLMINNAIIHATEVSEYSYFGNKERIIEHPSGMAWSSFMFLLSQMDINLYNTYTETWGQIVIESMAVGVPCLTNNSSGVLDYNNDLKRNLVVEEHDNPTAISEQIKLVFERKDEINTLSVSYLEELKRIAAEKISVFLNS